MILPPSLLARVSSPSNNADPSCVHGLGRKDTPSEEEMPVALGTSLFLGTVMDLLVLERAPLGAIRNGYLDTSGCRLLPRGTKHFLVECTRRVPAAHLSAPPESCRVYSAFPAEMQTQNLNSINRGRAVVPIRNLPALLNSPTKAIWRIPARMGVFRPSVSSAASELLNTLQSS